MVRAVAFVPGSPLLVPGLGGRADVLAGLRGTCLDAVRALGPGPISVLADATPGRYPAGDIGRWLAATVGSTVSAAPAVDDGDALLVVADGSATRGPQAPLAGDPRAEPWDDALAAALARGDLEVDLGAGADLGAPAAVWRAAASLTAGRSWQAQLLAHEAPLGVAYLVATWT